MNPSKNVRIANILSVITLLLTTILVSVGTPIAQEEYYKQGLKDGSKWALDTVSKMINKKFGDSSTLFKNDTLIINLDNNLKF